MDTISKAKRSQLMAKIKAKNTKPEMIVRKLTHALGFRYRLHRKDLPGKPDLVFPARKKVIFVHGCFWHLHAACKAGHIPKSNQDYWKTKLEKNVRRDKDAQKQLKALGWECLVIWECETKNIGDLETILTTFLY